LIRNFGNITIVALFLASSCKKDTDYSYDREANLVLDTATYLKSATYVSHTPTTLTMTVDLVTFNGLTCETDYSANTFIDTLGGAADISADLSTTTTVSHSPANVYSSAFVFNWNNRTWIEDHYVGFYMRRYLEIIDVDPAVYFAAMVSMDLLTTGVDDVSWRSESSNTRFSNSWAYNINAFYEITNSNGQLTLNQDVSGYDFLYAMDEILDTLLIDPGVFGEKSITIFSAADAQNNPASDVENDALITNAKANGAKINFLGPDISDVMVRYATETGGFTCEIFNDTSNEEGNEAQIDPVSDMAVYMQNLHLILNHDVVSHRCTAVYTQTGANTFDSGDRYQFKVLYNGEIFIYSVQIP